MIVQSAGVGGVAVPSVPGPALSAGRDIVRFWHAVLGRLQLDVSPASYETWLSPTRPVGLIGGRLVVEAASAFAANHLNEQLAIVIRRAVEEVADSPVAVDFVPQGSAAAAGQARVGAAPAPRIGSLCPSYRFDSFHVGEGNRVAVAVCRGLRERGSAASPAIVWGCPGIGKTHLLHATAAEACLAGWSVACLSAEEFTNRYMASIRGDGAGDFQTAIRGVRMLLIDDIQYLEGKRGTGDEVIRTMDAVIHAGGVFVAASEVHPSRLSLPDRLKSRLLAGSTAELSCLEADERTGFIRAVANDLRVPLPDWAVDRISGLRVRSMRVLRGAVCMAVSLQQAGRLDLRRLDVELVRMGDETDSLSDSEVMEAVGRCFGVTVDEIAGRSRSGPVRDARAVAVAVLRDRGASLSQLAARLGDRDPSTVSGLADRGRKLIERSPDLAGRLAG